MSLAEHLFLVTAVEVPEFLGFLINGTQLEILLSPLIIRRTRQGSHAYGPRIQVPGKRSTSSIASAPSRSFRPLLFHSIARRLPHECPLPLE